MEDLLLVDPSLPKLKNLVKDLKGLMARKLVKKKIKLFFTKKTKVFFYKTFFSGKKKPFTFF
jgi:hypothetical protein